MSERKRGIIAYGIAILVGVVLAHFDATFVEAAIACVIMVFVLLPWIFLGEWWRDTR